MKIYEGYILVSEITQKANKASSWLYSIKGIDIEYIGGVPVIKKSLIPYKYKHLSNDCQDLRNYYPYAEFSRELGRVKDFLNVLECQRRKANKKEFESLKINGYRLLKLSDEFIELIEKRLNPYKLRQNCNINDYKVVIEMQDMKIGFY